jgi:hypothetical protein
MNTKGLPGSEILLPNKVSKSFEAEESKSMAASRELRSNPNPIVRLAGRMLGSILLSSSQLIGLAVELCTDVGGGADIFNNTSIFVLFAMIRGS